MNSMLPIATLGETIRAHIEAGDKSTSKAEEHYKAAGIHLKEAKLRVQKTRGLTWSRFLLEHCHVKRSRADELIQIADGRTTNASLNERKYVKYAARLQRQQDAAASRGHLSEKPQQNQHPGTGHNSVGLIVCPKCGHEWRQS